MELTEALRHALDGEAVLFLGAGFSLGAVNKAGRGFPLGTHLSEHLLERLGENERVPLEQAAELYIDQHGEVGLLAELNLHLGVQRVASHHEEFANVPWRRVYTTNYDEVFETACRKQGVRVTPSIATKPLSELDPRCLDCVHLNGFLPWAKVGNIDQTLILTERSYLESKVPHSPWLRLFKDDLRAARAIVFLGYSVRDLDISRILVGRAIVRKAVFVVQTDPGLALRTTVAKFGNMSPVGVEGAADACSELRAWHKPRRSPLEFTSFARLASVLPRGEPPRVEEIFNLFIRGDVDLQLLAQGVTDSSQRYLVARRVADEVADRLTEGARVIAVLGRVANGKTVLLEQICLKLVDRFDVFRFNRHTPSLEAEIAALRAPERPAVVVVDDYARHLPIVRSLFLGATQNLSVLLTCRTPTHLTHLARLQDAIGAHEMVEYRIDHLSDLELQQLDSILAGAGLLGDLANKRAVTRTQVLGPYL